MQSFKFLVCVVERMWFHNHNRRGTTYEQEQILWLTSTRLMLYVILGENLNQQNEHAHTHKIIQNEGAKERNWNAEEGRFPRGMNVHMRLNKITSQLRMSLTSVLGKWIICLSNVNRILNRNYVLLQSRKIFFPLNTKFETY